MAGEPVLGGTAVTAATPSLSSIDVAEVQRHVVEASGIVLLDKQYLIESRLRPVAIRLAGGDVTRLVEQLRRGDAEAQLAVVEAMTTNETSFFRNDGVFGSLLTVLRQFEQAAGGSRTVRVWSAACSTGQEPYSLAMLVADELPALMEPGRFRIFATDLDSNVVARTAAARYSSAETRRGLNEAQLRRHFVEDGGEVAVRRQLRSLVQTRQLNLIADWGHVPQSDIVLLRNVLIYFSVETRRQILERVRRDVLRPGGYLVLGGSETALGVHDGYESETVDGQVLYRARD